MNENVWAKALFDACLQVVGYTSLAGASIAAAKEDVGRAKDLCSQLLITAKQAVNIQHPPVIADCPGDMLDYWSNNALDDICMDEKRLYGKCVHHGCDGDGFPYCPKHDAP